MKNKKVLILLGIVILLAGFYLVTEKQSEKEMLEAQLEEDLNQEQDLIDAAVEEYMREQEAEISSDSPAPNFSLLNLKGEEVSLSDYKGKIVLVNFWATWCQFCDIEMPDLEKLSKEHDDLVVLAVNVMESEKKVSKYIEDGGYSFPVLLDSKGNVSREYLASGLPASYFIDRDGILLGRAQGLLTYEQMEQVIEEVRDYQENK